LVVLLRLLLGVAEAAFFVASIMALVDLAPPSRIGEAISYNSLGLYLGLAFGPPLGELLVEMAGFGAAWYGAAALSLIAAIVAAGITNVRSGAPAAAGRIQLIYWKAVPAALGFFASVVAMGALFAFGSLQSTAVGLRPASTPLFVYGLVVVAGRLSLARVLDRLRPLLLGAAALVIISGGLVIMAVWSAPAGMVLGSAVLALGSPSVPRRSSPRSSRPQRPPNGAPPPAPRVFSLILVWVAVRCCLGWQLRREASPSPSVWRQRSHWPGAGGFWSFSGGLEVTVYLLDSRCALTDG